VTAARRPRRPVSGILLLDKPLGWSSNQALQKVRGLYQADRAGHAGSLDPLATGMLPICLGEARKFCSHLLDANKTYRAVVTLGIATTTGDREGAVTATGPEVSAAALEAAMAVFRGPISQVPPMHSALKRDGQPLYKLARRGETVGRPARAVIVHELRQVGLEDSQPVLWIRCSKGTYIRTLVEDIARSAGTVGHVAALRRVAIEPFGAAPMLTMDSLVSRAAAGPAALDDWLLPVDAGLSQLPRVDLDPACARRLANGLPVRLEAHRPPPGTVRLYADGQGFFGLGEIRPGPELVPIRLKATQTASAGNFLL
jgi:tRNA pseudouridine55 synthase